VSRNVWLRCYEVKQVKADFIQFEYIFHSLKCGWIEDFSDFPDESWMVHGFSRVFCDKKKVPEN